MNLASLIHPELVRMRLQTPTPDLFEGEAELTANQRREFREAVIGEIVEMFARAASVNNPSKLLRDLVNRERRASTAIGHGVAFPHVHTLQAREMIVGVAMAREGIPFGPPEADPVNLIIAIVAPPEEDRLYLNVVRRFSEMFQGDAILPQVLAARDEREVARILGENL